MFSLLLPSRSAEPRTRAEQTIIGSFRCGDETAQIHSETMSDGLMQINQSLSATATAAATASSASSSAAAASPPLCDGLEHLRQPTCYPLEAAMLLRVVMTSCTALTLAATLLSLVLVLKYRHHKVGLLSISLHAI